MDRIVFFLCALWSSAVFGWAPSTPVTVMIPFAPGSGNDVVSRPVVQYMRDRGVTVTYEYRVGGDGVVGMNRFKRMPPNGQHIAVTGNMSNFVASDIYNCREKRYSLEDFEFLTLIARTPFALVTRATWDGTLLSFLSDAKRGRVRMGVASSNHKLVTHLLFKQLHADAQVVGYGSAPQLLHDVVGGHIDGTLQPLNTVVPLQQSGQLQLLAVTSEAGVGGVPALREYFPGYVVWATWGVVLPRNTPADVTAFYQNLLGEALTNPHVQSSFVARYTEVPVGSLGVAAFRAHISHARQQFGVKKETCRTN